MDKILLQDVQYTQTPIAKLPVVAFIETLSLAASATSSLNSKSKSIENEWKTNEKLGNCHNHMLEPSNGTPTGSKIWYTFVLYTLLNMFDGGRNFRAKSDKIGSADFGLDRCGSTSDFL